jgi:hypothetical protein
MEGDDVLFTDAKSRRAGDISKAAGAENLGVGGLKDGIAAVDSCDAAAAGNTPKRLTIRIKVAVIERTFFVFTFFSSIGLCLLFYFSYLHIGVVIIKFVKAPPFFKQTLVLPTLNLLYKKSS